MSAKPPARGTNKLPNKILIYSWPKMVFMWPTALMSLFMGAATYIAGEGSAWSQTWGTLFLVTFALNMMVVTFEFPRGNALVMVFGIVAAAWGLVTLNQHFEFMGPISRFLKGLQLYAHPHFYFFLLFIYVIMFIGMYVITRFSYWEISSNELVHHSGLWGDEERFSTAGLKYNKEIADIFEKILAGAGRIIFHAPAMRIPVVLDNVLGIDRVAKNLDTLLDVRRVEVAEEMPRPDATDE